MSRLNVGRATLLILSILASNLVLAGEKQQQPGKVANRQEMAAMHEKMAKCLRSDKPMNECHDQMMGSRAMCEGMMSGDMSGMMGEDRHKKKTDDRG